MPHLSARVIAVVASVLGLTIFGVIPAHAGSTTDVNVQVAQSAPSIPSSTRVNVPFSSAVSLQDAIKTKTVRGYAVESYRFENAEIVGEFSPSTGISVKEYLSNFQSAYGTQPQITAAVINVPSGVAQSWATARMQPEAAPGAAFTAPPASVAAINATLATFRAGNSSFQTGATNQSVAPEGMSAAAATRWDPTQADIQIFRINSSIVYISQYYYWDGTTARNSVLNGDDGWEAEVNAFSSNSAVAGGTRPNCTASNYKDYPFAKNYSWTWAALVNVGNGMQPVGSSVGAYADYNDLSDACNRNSLAIGIRNPQLLPSYPNGAQEVMVTIQAPRGIDNTSSISGVMQAVNETYCNLNPWMSNTDCMGVSSSSSGARPTLNQARGWTAPTTCWRSNDWGNNPPVKYAC